MLATIDLAKVHELASMFPNGSWRTIHAHTFTADRKNGLYRCTWDPTKDLEGIGGVYAILLPVQWFSPKRAIPLHAPHRHKGEKISFEFTLEKAAKDDDYGVVYVGRTTNLRQRWRGHLSRGERKDGGQVKFGLLDCQIESHPENALRKLRQDARIIYTELPGADNCANRDVLEMALCARFAPPFNIKSER